MERTLVIIKPDGVQRGLVGDIIHRLERRGLQLNGLKLMHISRELAEEHYGVHRGKPFFNGVVAYLSSSPAVVMVWEGPRAISVVRTTMGATNAADAAPGTIRGDLAIEIGRNLIHGSDSAETAAFEIGLYFAADDVVSYQRLNQPWITEG